MSGAEAERLRLKHLEHCRRHNCFARGSGEFCYFQLPEEHTEGPAHGVRLTTQGEVTCSLIREFTLRPLLVERERGPCVLTIACNCPNPGLHQDLCCHLCAEFNKR
ncbi:unnamed protein product [Simian adenovirus 31]